MGAGADASLIGQNLGPYRVVERIGQGGMATVYKAYQASLDRYVAVKVLPPYYANEPDFALRFTREARAVAKLDHPHILPVYDFGREGDLSYIAMKYVAAGTLKLNLGQPLPLPQVAEVISQIASALDYAHEQGVIHRDVKPKNVLMERGRWALLTDFGLAKMVEGSVQITGTGVGLGTPAYMSPEQGLGQAVDARSDVYSLGVMLYEMVTGHVPYEAETPLAVVLQHISAPLPLPSAVRPDVPEAVERVILKALAKNPGDRFQSAGELAAALSAAASLASEAAAPPKPTTVEPVAGAGRFPARAAAGLRGRIGLAAQTGWGRAVMWAVGLVALLALVLVLSRGPLKVQTRGEQPETAQVVEITPTKVTTPAATPTVLAAAELTPTETAMTSATATPTPEPTATAPATATPTPKPTATPSLLVVPLQLRITSTSDWAELAVVSPWTIVSQQMVETGGTTTMAEMTERAIHLDQSEEQAREGRAVYMVQDVTLSGVPAGEILTFAVSKGCWGRTTVEVSNLVTGVPLLVQRFENDTCDRKPFTVPADVMVAARVRATPTPEPTRLPQIIPAGGESGKILGHCQGVRPPQICVHDVATNSITQITHDLAFASMYTPAWSPDGTQIVFNAGLGESDAHDIYLINADGSGLRQLTEGDAFEQNPGWSPDGEWIAFSRDCELWRMHPDSSDEQALFVPDEGCADSPAWSPDSQRLAFPYTQAESRQSIWVMHADGSDPHQIYAFEGPQPAGWCVWTPAGKRVLCWHFDQGVEQRVLINADGSGETATIDGVPHWWQPTGWPQWGGAQ